MIILFIGSFLSRQTGTKSIAEKLAEYWKKNDGPQVLLVSRHSNKYLRLISILLGISIFRGKLVNVDVFSGSSLVIAEFATKMAKFRGLKLIMTLRGGAIPEDLNRRAERYLRILRQADYIQSPSHFVANAIEDKFGLKTNYCPNPINLDRFVPSPKTQGSNILWVRAFSEIYNPDLAIKTLSIVKNDFPDIKLTMVGPDKGLLLQTKELVKDLELDDSVIFAGPVENEKLISFYQNHAIYLNTTSYESFGTAVLEAAATSMPIVSTKVGELPYLWKHGVNILFSDELNAEGLAKQVLYLLQDKKMAMSIGRSGLKRVEEFELKRISNSWVNLFKKLESN